MNETNLGKIDRTTIDSEVHAIDHGAILYSQAGAARVRINFDVWELRGHDVLIFFPGDVVKWEMMDDDIRYSSDILRAASLNVEHAVYEQLRADRRCGYRELIDVVVNSMFRIFDFYFTQEHYLLTDRIVTLHLQAFFLGFYDYLQAHPREDNQNKIIEANAAGIACETDPYDDSAHEIGKKLKENGMPGRVSIELFYSYKVEINGKKKNAFFEKNPYVKMTDYKYEEGTAPKYADEIAITDKIRKEYGVDIGDKVVVEFTTGKKTCLITAVHTTMNQLGDCFLLHTDAPTRPEATTILPLR